MLQEDKFLKDEEDVTKHGEFVCSEFKWLPIEIQKVQAKKMEIITMSKK